MCLHPFAWTNVSSGKKRLFCTLGALTQNSWIRPIMSYLWMIGLEMRLFSCGANHWKLSASIQSKKVQPLGFYFWHLRLGLLKSPFLVGEAKHLWLYHFCKDKCIFRKKRLFCNLGALTQNSWIRPIMCYLWMIGLVMRLFSCGANLWRSSASIQQKKVPAPWILFLAPAPRPLEVTFFGWWSWTSVVVPLLQGQMYFQKETPVLQFGRVDTKFLNSSHHVYICGWLAWRCDFFPLGPTFENYPQVFSQKKVQPLGFYVWPLRLGLLKSLFWLVKVNICVCTLLQNHVKNHTPSIRHGTFFSWGLTFRYVLVNSPHENYFPVAGRLYTTGK